MHHPRSISAARRLRLASQLLLANRLLIPIAGGSIIVSLFANDRLLLIYGVVVATISVLLLVSQWIAASQASCPLCRTRVLAPLSCMKHRQARPFLGSYQLRVALAIVFKGRFRCPYCNESTAMEVRETLRVTRPRGYDMTKISRFH